MVYGQFLNVILAGNFEMPKGRNDYTSGRTISGGVEAGLAPRVVGSVNYYDSVHLSQTICSKAVKRHLTDGSKPRLHTA